LSDFRHNLTRILHGNINWLLNSGIRIKNGHDSGGFYGWKYLQPQPSYPFIYSEITGYAVTYFSWIYSEFNKPAAMQAAKESGNWLLRNLSSNLIFTGRSKVNNFTQKGDLSNQVYAFDNGIILIGLLNLYKVTTDSKILIVSENIAKAIIERFFDGTKLLPLLDKSFKPITNNKKHKWSTIPGAYHSKISLGFLKLYELLGEKKYLEVSNKLCDFALTLQKNNGRFITNYDSNVTYLHPHLYSCEGLIYAGIKQSNDRYYNAGLKGISWAVRQMNPINDGLPRSTIEKKTIQSDCVAQLLRLLIVLRSDLIKKSYFTESRLETIINKLCFCLVHFYVSEGEDKGGMKYQISLDSICSWCTMFSSQAFGFYIKRNEAENSRWMDFYI
jgi:hypothetical protein